jgi:hypothetical protein
MVKDQIIVSTFKDALLKTTNKKRLLLGNGFSIACREDIFTYEALLDEADFSKVSKTIPEIFKHFKTQDFEMIIKKLLDSSEIVKIYNQTTDNLSKNLKKDAEILKEVLVQVITKKHPGLPRDISDEEYKACAAFLSHFDKIYTLNYDLLLYWTIMYGIEHSIWKEPVDDGFAYEEGEDYVTWENSHYQNIFFLHGGLHIFDNGTNFKKLTYTNTGVPLIEQIRSALAKGLYPHFVAEGSANEKQERINHSIFLDKGFRSLREIKEDLFIYGHSLASNDMHILDLIPNGKVSNLFISLYGDVNLPYNQQIIRQAFLLKRRRETNDKKSKNPLNVFFYGAESANVWGKG